MLIWALPLQAFVAVGADADVTGITICKVNWHQQNQSKYGATIIARRLTTTQAKCLKDRLLDFTI